MQKKLTFSLIIIGVFSGAYLIAEIDFNSKHEDSSALKLDISSFSEISNLRNINNKSNIILSIVSGSCSSNATEINNLQMLFEQEANNKSQVIFLVMGELDYYIKTILHDSRFIKFPAINDVNYSIFDGNTFLTEDDRVIILDSNNSIVYRGNPLYNKDHFNKLMLAMEMN